MYVIYLGYDSKVELNNLMLDQINVQKKKKH